MPAYQYVATVTAASGVLVQWFTDPACTHPALLSTHVDQPATAPLLPMRTDPLTGVIPTLYGDAATVYVQQVSSDPDNPSVGLFLCSISGTPVGTPPFGGGGGSGVDATARAAAASAATAASAAQSTASSAQTAATAAQSTANSAQTAATTAQAAVTAETSRAEAAESINATNISANASAITAETARAQAAEQANATNIAANATAITTNSTAITNEVTRATAAEATKKPKFAAPVAKNAAFTAAVATPYVLDISGGSYPVGMPSAAAAGLGAEVVAKIGTAAAVPGATAATFTPAGSDTINGATAGLPLRLLDQAKIFVSDGVSNWTALSGDLSLTALGPYLGSAFSFAPWSSRAQFPITRYGAVCNGVRVLDASTISGAATVTSASYTFTQADVGTTIGVAMPLGTFPDAWVSTIQSVASGVATLATNAPSTVSAAECSFGTPDDAALAAALAAAVANGGGTITIPSNTRTILTANIAWANGVDLVGASRETSILTVITSSTASIIQAPSAWAATGNAPLTGCRFERFKIEARQHTASAYSSSLKPLNIYNVCRVTVNDCWLENCPATAIPCDESTTQCSITHNLITNPGRMNLGTGAGGSGIGCGSAGQTDSEPTFITGNVVIGDGVHGRFGIFIENQNSSATSASQSYGYRVSGNYVSGMQVGLGDEGTRNTLWANNHATACTLAGLHVGHGTYGPGQPGQFTLFVGNQVYGNTGYGVLLDFSGTGSLYGSQQFVDNTITGNTLNGICALLDKATISEVVIRGNYIKGNSLSGIRLMYATGHTLAGTSDYAAQNWVIDSNTVLDNAGSNTSGDNSGIRFDVPLVSCSITRNKITDNRSTKIQAYGISFGGNVQYITGTQVEDNNCAGNLTAGYSSATTFSWDSTSRVVNNVAINPFGVSSTSILGSSGAAITVGSSPYTYTAGTMPETVYINGGTVSAVAKAGGTVATASPTVVNLAPGETVTVTYTAAPTMVRDRR